MSADETALLAARVLSHTRSLHLFDSSLKDGDAALLRGISNIRVPLYLVKAIAADADEQDADAGIPPSAASSCSIRRIHLGTAPYHRIVEISVRARANLTHICGNAGNSSSAFEYGLFKHNPGEWMRAIMAALPNLTHVGFDIIYLSEFPSDIVIVNEEWDVGAFERAMETALSYQQLNVVAVRVTGGFLLRWDDIISMLCRVAGSDRRLQAWKDDRGVSEWHEEDERMALDAFQGRSIWTMVRPVQDVYVQ